MKRDELLLLSAFMDWMGTQDIGLGRVRRINGKLMLDNHDRPRLIPLTAQEGHDLAARFLAACQPPAMAPDLDALLNAGGVIPIAAEGVVTETEQAYTHEFG